LTNIKNKNLAPSAISKGMPSDLIRGWLPVLHLIALQNDKEAHDLNDHAPPERSF
jgi:hypothetical protein